MDIIKHRNIFFIFSAILILASIFAFFRFGMKEGIDLVGGTNWQIQINNTAVSDNDLRTELTALSGYSNLTMTSLPDRNFIVRFPSISEENHQKYLQALQAKFSDVKEQGFQSIGPTIGQELKARFLWAGLIGLLAILCYVAYAFRKVSYPVKSFKYAIIGIICLFHDIIIPVGIMAFLGWRNGTEIDTNFIVALLFILGFSMHDTIVVFDRIRENLILTNNKNKFDFAGVINSAVKQTFGRSINTSLTVVLAMLPLYVFGPFSLKYFVLTLIIGTIVGTYSSIFIASPLLYVWRPKNK